MATFCWLLALLTWPRQAASVSKGASLSLLLQICLAICLAITAGLCKESGFCVLLQLAVMELLRSPGLISSRNNTCIWFLLAFGAVFGVRSWFTGGTKAGFSYVDTPVQYHDDIYVRFFTYTYFHSKYAQLMVFPWTLSWDYSVDALPLLRATWRDARVLGILASYLTVVALASWGCSARNRKILAGLSNVIIPFVPASNLFFVVGVTVGERLLYPCNVGAAMLLAGVSADVGGSRRQAKLSRGRPILFALGLCLQAVFCYRCIVRVQHWSSKESLFSPDAVAYPRSTKARHQLGTALHREGRFEEALVNFKAALDVFDQSALTEYCIAQIYIETGRVDEAVATFEHIMDGHMLGFGNFNVFSLYIDYGFAKMMQRKFEEAIPMLKQGLQLNEDVPHGLNALAYSYFSIGRLEEAQGALETGLRYDMDNPYLHNNLGVVMAKRGNVEKGAEFIIRAATAQPDVPAFSHNVLVLRYIAENQKWPPQDMVLELYFNRGG
eukprot:TRINITY_DN39554_c0_g3_i1.p1 TRINITY_DN39554_c0_g3~~TRINITY_DN39554_c0_g3_i1.p1  ORF type:complete len:542 (+),score=51.68 TRINITY_DN39554_c0_g3_i1:137-1627(+)